MDCTEVVFSGHAIRRMFERALGRDAILEVVARGETLAEYLDDQPYPSYLVLGFIAGEPIHVVVARDPQTRGCFVVTAYSPDPVVWSDDFRKRR